MQRRRDSDFDIEEGPTLEQISNETGTPLYLLQQLDPSSLSKATSLTRRQSPTFAPKNAPRHRSLRQSPRRTTHYVREDYLCQCPHVKRVVFKSSMNHVTAHPVEPSTLTTLTPVVDHSLPPRKNGVSKYLDRGVVRGTARSTKHFVREGFVCECPHMRRVY